MKTQTNLTEIEREFLRELSAMYWADSPRYNWSEPVHLFYHIDLGSIGCDRHLVVVGDGNNGCYDWAEFRDAQFVKSSNAGYGMTEVCLRDGLIAMDL